MVHGSNAATVLRDHKGEDTWPRPSLWFRTSAYGGMRVCRSQRACSPVRRMAEQAYSPSRHNPADATADIDGVSDLSLAGARQGATGPLWQPRHHSRSTAHQKRISEYLKTAPNQRAYVEWMVGTIKEHMAPGERGLVICKKALFDAERVPQWPEGDLVLKRTRQRGLTKALSGVGH